MRTTNERLRHKCNNRPDDFPVDLFSLQLDELKLLQVEAPETKSQQSWCSPDDLDLLFDNSLGAFMVSQFNNDNEKLISSAASDDGYTFATPLPTPPFTPSSSQGRTPCSSGQSSPRRYSSGQVSPVWERSGMLDGAEGGSSKDTKEKLPRYKRPSHIKAEYKRRGKIQNGFDKLQSVVPSLVDTQQPAGKRSKSTMLLKTVEFLRHIRNENKSLQRETDKLRAEICVLTGDINRHQEELPAAGLIVAPPILPPAPTDMQSMFEEYLLTRTRQNWKFWIFGLIVRPLFNTFNSIVATASPENFCQMLLNWVETHCSLLVLRPTVFQAVRHLGKKTSILTAPERLPQDVVDLAV
ncbi:Carbohydrate-responsive element-binding protein [Lamellibrachia satsuma]|nr:Carbohydrate-responsive element-binding protein [Lamellibrachia satsuma]